MGEEVGEKGGEVGGGGTPGVQALARNFHQQAAALAYHFNHFSYESRLSLTPSGQEGIGNWVRLDSEVEGEPLVASVTGVDAKAPLMGSKKPKSWPRNLPSVALSPSRLFRAEPSSSRRLRRASRTSSQLQPQE